MKTFPLTQILRLAAMAAVSGMTVLAAGGDTLRLEEAIQLALQHSHSVQRAKALQTSADASVKATRTHRLPVFRSAATAGILLTRPKVTFERGAFGTYGELGPIPGDATTLDFPRRPAAFALASAALPLTQQIGIGHEIRLAQTERQIAAVEVAMSQQEIIKEVRDSYYLILQAESSRIALDQQRKLLTELERETARHVDAGNALDADLLTVQARLAKLRHDESLITGPADNARERLNLLLGRPVDTAFQIAPLLESEWTLDLPAARRKALSTRPELEQARLRIRQAEIEKQKKKAEYIPNVSLAVTYASALNLGSGLPRNIAIAGFQGDWEVFDWGRKRHELAAQSSRIEAARHASQESEEQVLREVGSAYRKLLQARLQREAGQAEQRSAAEAARLAAVRYGAESALLRDVLEAQGELASATEKVHHAELAYWSARAELDKAMGENK
jgi:outer membrane protein